MLGLHIVPPLNLLMQGAPNLLQLLSKALHSSTGRESAEKRPAPRCSPNPPHLVTMVPDIGQPWVLG
eukprot:7918768-Alexandrium_andersonii.AAC.1